MDWHLNGLVLDHMLDLLIVNPNNIRSRPRRLISLLNLLFKKSRRENLNL